MQLHLILLCLLAPLAALQSNDGVFYNPPQPGPNGDFSQNPVYQIGSTVQLRWSVSWDRISMTLWQNGNNNFEYLLPNVTNPNYYNWIVSTNKDISAQSGKNGTVFFLAGYLPGTTTPFTCHFFNITNAGPGGLLSTAAGATAAPTTTVVQTITPSMPSETTVVVTLAPDTSSMSTTTTVTSSLPPPSTILSVPSPSTIPSSTPPTATAINAPSDTGLSPTTKIGMGVGIGIGVPALVALGVFVGWMLRASSKRREPSTMPYAAPHSRISLDKHRPRMVHEVPGHLEELAGPDPAFELPPDGSQRGSMNFF